MIMNRIRRLMDWRIEREDYGDITPQIQKQILKKRYADGKQNKLYRNPPKFSRSVVRYVNLTSKGTENVILFEKKELGKLG